MEVQLNHLAKGEQRYIHMNTVAPKTSQHPSTLSTLQSKTKWTSQPCQLTGRSMAARSGKVSPGMMSLVWWWLAVPLLVAVDLFWTWDDGIERPIKKLNSPYVEKRHFTVLTLTIPKTGQLHTYMWHFLLVARCPSVKYSSAKVNISSGSMIELNPKSALQAKWKGRRMCCPSVISVM